jgi:hypothetical protein
MNTNIKVKFRNIITKSIPKILHCPNENPEHIWNFACKYFTKKKAKIKLPEDTTLITFNNRLEKCLLEKNLESLEIEHVVLGKKIKNWHNRKKINLLKEYLENVKTTYILVMDGDDSLIVDDLNKLPDYLNYLKCSVIFNASNFTYPEDSNGFYQNNEKKLSNESFFRHLNSGCFFGKTKFCKYLYDLSSVFKNDIINRYHYSDQIILKHFYIKMYPEIQVDCDCNFFQIFHSKIPIKKFLQVLQII